MSATAVVGIATASLAGANASFAAPALSSKPAASAMGEVHPMAGWHFYRAYWTKAACVSEGESLPYDYYCTGGYGSDGNWKYFLYVWY
ncbi:hypothetical protein ACFV2N_43790 [Streptomyces sp. NPDC059680]|uniref:hypothetical protein n=1 Tax=Streptomyces sp. NPDC059680 TaxID=3346904 RepID=UPI0036AD21E7